MKAKSASHKWKHATMSLEPTNSSNYKHWKASAFVSSLEMPSTIRTDHMKYYQISMLFNDFCLTHVPLRLMTGSICIEPLLQNWPR